MSADDENEVKRQLLEVRLDKEHAIRAQEFERAAQLREQETMLSEKLHEVSSQHRDSIRQGGMKEVDFAAILADLQASLNRLEIRFDRLERRLLSE